MNEFTIEIDDWGHKELKEYLISLKGIFDVSINDDKQLVVTIKYDSKLITPKIITSEILLFLNIFKIPSILAFDKHPNFKTREYLIVRKDICCDYCFKGAVDELLDIPGIEKVDSNFMEEYFLKKYDDQGDIIIKIRYDPSVISLEKMQQIEIELDI